MGLCSLFLSHCMLPLGDWCYCCCSHDFRSYLLGYWLPHLPLLWTSPLRSASVLSDFLLGIFPWVFYVHIRFSRLSKASYSLFYPLAIFLLYALSCIAVSILFFAKTWNLGTIFTFIACLHFCWPDLIIFRPIFSCLPIVAASWPTFIPCISGKITMCLLAYQVKSKHEIMLNLNHTNIIDKRLFFSLSFFKRWT